MYFDLAGAFLAVLVTFVCFCNIFCFDLVTGAAACEVSSFFGEFSCFFGSSFPKRFARFRIRLQVLVNFVENLFSALRINCFFRDFTCFRSWFFSCHAAKTTYKGGRLVMNLIIE